MSKDKVNNKNNSKSKKKWILNIIIWTTIICGSVTLLSDALLRKVNMLVAFIILTIIIFIGIIFDTIGVAVTAADEVPFHSMASKKIEEAKISIKLIRNADKVSNFCNDIIGDICGIVSGSVGFLIAQKISIMFPNLNITIISALIGAIIASITISGKALGKGIGINNSFEIILKVSKIIFFMKKLLKRIDKYE